MAILVAIRSADFLTYAAREMGVACGGFDPAVTQEPAP